MSRLGGRFTGLLRVSVAREHAQDLASALGKLESSGLQIIVQESDSGEPVDARRVLRLELVGQDHPGIVRQLSQALSNRRVNVEELETSVSSAPMSGESLFHASASLLVPSDTALDELRETLEKIANELMVDLSFDESA
jgi:glycine cleavage system regulatory protein